MARRNDVLRAMCERFYSGVWTGYSKTVQDAAIDRMGEALDEMRRFYLKDDTRPTNAAAQAAVMHEVLTQVIGASDVEA